MHMLSQNDDKYLKGTQGPVVTRDKGVLSHGQPRQATAYWAAERHTLHVSFYLGLEAEDCDRYANQCSYSHGQKHCLCFVIAVKYINID